VNDRNLVRLTDETADLLASIARSIQTLDQQGQTVLDRIRAGYNGHPKAASYTGSERVARTPDPLGFPDGENPDRDSHLPGDPTGEAAIRFDRAHQHRRRIEAITNRMHNFAVELESILVAYTPRPATAADRAKVERDNDPGCHSCSRLEVSPGQPRWEPVHVTGTVAGNLDEPQALCRWCYDHVRSTGRLPHVPELQDHHDGKKVRRSA